MKCFELEDRMIDIGKNVAVKLRIGYMVRQVESLFPSVMTAFNRLYPQSVVYAIDGHLSDHEEPVSYTHLMIPTTAPITQAIMYK